jgi:hypothetical protein
MDKRNDGAEALLEFTWERQPEAEGLVRELVGEFLGRCPEGAGLAERMRVETGTRLVDWVGWIGVAGSKEVEERVRAAGFVARKSADGAVHFVQPHGVFPRVRLFEDSRFEVAIKVDRVESFVEAQGVGQRVEGYPGSVYRRVCAWGKGDVKLWAEERHGYTGFEIPPVDARRARAWADHAMKLRNRWREYPGGDDAAFFDETLRKVVDPAVAELGRDLACDAFFAAEREYWQGRNRAAQFQKARQDRLGLGWANHDHHTYRCSREHFARLIAVWEKLGFELRERFYAGAEAGWGAQICEQPVTGIITFNDVDLAPEELMNDFSHEPLPERKELGTVGLWCALHGESFLQAGMHHLECQFDFDSLKQQMERDAGIKVMKPFTDFPYLRQAFTEGERWPVKAERIERLLAKGQITAEQAKQFRENGAIGSHLENLERNEGFKGFNQKGVSEIIAKTDPRKNVVRA